MKKTFYIFLVLTSVILHSPQLTASVSPERLKAIFTKHKRRNEVDITKKVSKICGENEVYGYVNAYCPKICGSINKCCPPEFQIDGCTCVDGYTRRSLKDPTCIPQDECEVSIQETKDDIWKQPKLENENLCGMRPVENPSYEFRGPPKLMKEDILEQPKLENEKVITDTPSTTPTTITTSTETPKHQCGMNEVYGSMRPNCPNTCDFINRTCVSEESMGGCVCAEGFTRRSLEDSTCIPQSECRVSPKVAKKVIWKQPMLQNEKRVITGTPSTTSSTTTTRTEAPKYLCGTNEVYGYMKLDCPNTCEFINEACSPKEIIEGCVCVDGYTRRSLEDSECIPQNECREHMEAFREDMISETSPKLEDEMQVTTSTPSTTTSTTTTTTTTSTTEAPENPCGENEIYGVMKLNCPNTCEFINEVSSSEETIKGCVCIQGYTRRSLEDSECIPQNECREQKEDSKEGMISVTLPKLEDEMQVITSTQGTTSTTATTATTESPKNRCGTNEVYGVMNAYCPKTCEFRNRLCLSEVLEEGCVCTEGYTRRSLEDPTCVPQNECKAVCSRPNFIWFNCYPLCDLTCQNRDRMKNCRRECGVGCLCDRGYVLDESKQVCVEKWHGCPGEKS